MTRTPKGPRHPVSRVDLNLYISKVDHVKEIADREDNHIRELLIEKEKQLIESRRLIEEQMRGYPEIFMTKEAYEKQHSGLVIDLKRIGIDVEKLKTERENTSKLIALSISLTAVVVALIAGISHALWGKVP